MMSFVLRAMMSGRKAEGDLMLYLSGGDFMTGQFFVKMAAMENSVVDWFHGSKAVFRGKQVYE